MKRTVEPELMNDPEQVFAYADADFASSDEAFVAGFFEHCGRAGWANVVDLGCGPGNIAQRLAQGLPETQVLGVDGAAEMLRLARERAQRAALDNLAYHRAVLPDPSLPRGHFDAVTSNSLLHHLHDPRVLWETVVGIARPGAHVWVGDLFRPSSPEQVERRVAQHASECPEVLRRDFRASLHAAFEPDEIEAQLKDAGLREARVRVVDDLHVWVHARVGG